MPPQERVGGDDRRDLAQSLTAYPNGACCESSPVVIGQPQALPTQLPPEEAVLFDQIGQGLPLAALPSAPIIRRLAALFALDAFAGGFVLQSLIAYWFAVRYGLRLDSLGWVFFAAQLLTALSFLAAAPLARRLGLIQTMVVTHLASNVLLIGVGLARSAPAAIALLLARQLLSQIDVPTRQAYVMSVVEDREREAAASITNVARTVAQAITPAFTGWVIQGLALAAPFVLGGGLKIVYDLLLYATFRSVPSRAGAVTVGDPSARDGRRTEG